MLWLGGLASIAFGIVLLAMPAVGVLALMWTAGIYALIFGVLLDTEAFRLGARAANTPVWNRPRARPERQHRLQFCGAGLIAGAACHPQPPATLGTQLMHTILITGAASGIGAGLAIELAAAGHHIIVSDVRREDTDEVTARIRGACGSVEALALDVTSDASVSAAVAAASRPVDLLVNNAGLQQAARLEEFPMARWDLLMQVMLTGVARLTRAVLPGMRARGFGRIVDIGSIHSLVASPYKSAYVAAKHGLVGFSRPLPWRPLTPTSPSTPSARAT